jgi:hypothetical protein
MHKIIRLFFITGALLLTKQGFAQNVAINEDGSAADAHAILDLKSPNKGVLIPRMSTTARLAIPNTSGLLVYDSTAGAFFYNTGAFWQSLATGNTTGWLLNGNSGNPSSAYLGTRDRQSLVIRVNDQPAGLIDPGSGPSPTSPVGFNTFWGLNAGFYLIPDSASFLTGIGGYALFGNTTGQNNTGVGWGSLSVNNTGSGNTAIGKSSMYSGVNTSNVTAVGYFANTASNVSNATSIGFDAFANASNKVRIGNAAVTVIEGQVPFTTPSDGRFKFKVKEDVKGLDFILQLRPVTYQFDTKRFDDQLHGGARASSTGLSKTKMPGTGDAGTNRTTQAAYDQASAIRRSGFIAQEVEKAADATGYDFSGIIKPKTEQDHYGLSYEAFVVPLVKAVQELNAEIALLRKENASMRTEMNELRKEVRH